MYSPKNHILEELVDAAAKSLRLNGVMGVDDSDELVNVMIHREFFAGIEFKHSVVI